MITLRLQLLLLVFFSAFRTQAQPYRQPMDNYEGTGATMASITMNPTITATHSETASGLNGRKYDEVAIEHPASEFTCPCTEAGAPNIDASPDGTPYSSLNLPDTLDLFVHHGCIAVAGRLIIDQDVTITGCANIRMPPCAEIVVNAFRQLRMEYNTIYGCDQM